MAIRFNCSACGKTLVTQTTKPAKCPSCGNINETPDPSVADFHDLLVTLRDELRTIDRRLRILLLFVGAITAIAIIAALTR